MDKKKRKVTYTVDTNFVGIENKEDMVKRQFAVDLIYNRMADEMKKEISSSISKQDWR